jgi:uncharacterized protein YyaL (SSP411 family)
MNVKPNVTPPGPTHIIGNSLRQIVNFCGLFAHFCPPKIARNRLPPGTFHIEPYNRTLHEPTRQPSTRSRIAACGSRRISEAPKTMGTFQTPMGTANRLAAATSPYLLQHAHNPVDWYEWGTEALERAKAEDKPIFLSIGYSACHWCHVMAHESFEDPAAAAVMNKYFINIKVDREERPDIDHLYMQATMLMNRGQGGWPMSVWLTPRLRPFFAGTYFPPTARWGRPGFAQVCQRIGELWNSPEDRKQLLAQGDELTHAIRDSFGVAAAPAGSGAALGLPLIESVAEHLSRAFDEEFGGMPGGGENKFPPSFAIDLMLRDCHTKPEGHPARARMERIVRLTLDQMSRGGIYDHLGGGIARYSTDREWHAPHFEKMLYDQALVSRCYLDASQYFNEPAYADVARSICDYIIADLQSPEGGIYSTRDADSEGEEGKYYVWTIEEVREACGDDDAAAVCAYYDVRPEGNWDDPHAPGVPKNILHIRRSEAEAAAEIGVDVAEFRARLARGRAKLLEVRGRRVPPGLDDKILAEWNGLMISSLARIGASLDEPRYVEAARRAASFILDHQRRDGRLLRSSRGGRTLDTAFLSDYAAMIDGLLELYEATFEKRWFDEALKLNDVAAELFWDPETGGYYFTANDHEHLIARHKDIRDGATPSGNSLQFLNLLRLEAMTGDKKLATMAERTLEHFHGELVETPFAYERFLSSVHFAMSGALEIAIVGDLERPETQALLRTVRTAYVPARVIMWLDPARPADAVSSPLLTGRMPVDGAPAAYVCRRYACERPVTTPAQLRELLRPTITDD